MHAFFIIILIEIIIIVFCKIGHIHKCSCYIVIYYFLKIFFKFFFLHETDFCVFANSLFYPFENVNQKYACKMLLP